LAEAAESGRAIPDPSRWVGTWEAIGRYDSNELHLWRSWRPELGGEFLRADMRVDMPNGFTFRSLAFWHSSAEGYDVVLMDEGGRFDPLRAVPDSSAGTLVIEFEDDSGDGPTRKRWIYRAQGTDAYTESLQGWNGGAWETLAEFDFHRTSGIPSGPHPHPEGHEPH
jgi:hypothetical protein